MAVEAFSRDYAEHYDLLYADKDYRRECDFVEAICQRFLGQRPQSVLDIGCGTGGHALLLAERGYEVTGVDRSEPMISVAEAKARRVGCKASFIVGAWGELDLERQYDVAIAMFNAIDYVIPDRALESWLLQTRRHVRPGGLFLFDYRNGVPSLRSYSPARTKWCQAGDKKLLRLSETELDPMKQLFHTRYRCFLFDGDAVVKYFEESHVVRFFFPLEIERFVADAGFETLATMPCFEIDSSPGPEDWNVMVVAKVPARLTDKA